MADCGESRSIPASWPCTRPWSSSPPTASVCAHFLPTTAPAIAHSSSVMPASRWPSNTAAQDRIRQEPTARPSDSSRRRCANGPTQNTGPTQSKEMPTCSHGSTITTAKDRMVASTTSRPSAAPIPEQPLDLLQVPHLRGVFVLAAKVGYKYLWSLALPSNFAHDSHSRDRICSSARPCLRQLSERVPEPLAGRRKHRHAAFALHELRTDTQLVGEYPAPKLARPAWPLPHLPRLDRLALSAGRGCARRTLGQNCLDISDKCT